MPDRLRVAVRGAVQGVGFRPFIYRLAVDMGLAGWVNNTPQGVFIEVEGERAILESFLLRIEREKPPISSIQSMESSFLDPVGYRAFEIRRSDVGGEKIALILPDIATCAECRKEIFDPADRRFRYPFTNCTNCGPRFTIVENLPYDRPNTSMKSFAMCDRCREEYENPRDRRFHAQPNACPECGPHLELWDGAGKVIADRRPALDAAASAIREGKIVAVKGLGGFHLMCDASKDDAVRLLRLRKRREEKPFALMYSSLESVRRDCEVSPLEERLLLSPEAPIALLRRSSRSFPEVAPRNPYLGVMLPYSPLHHLLMAELAFPVVATSGNLSDEPICTDEREAVARLGAIADSFLVHNRPIVRHVDDSIARIMAGREIVLRRARGYAPLPIHVGKTLPTVVAVGAHLKNTVAISKGNSIFVGQHIGDLESTEAFDAFRRVVADLQRLYEIRPAAVACDAHPDYLSTTFARKMAVPLTNVQHHYAHILSCMVENELEGSALGVAWDGTGYGSDGTIWGGEFLRITGNSFRRVAHFRTFRLPGGERAIKEPRRCSIGLLYELLGEALFERRDISAIRSFPAAEIALVQQAMRQRLNAPVTSSAGRLFDAVASIAGLRQTVRFEGQAAMELEFALDGVAIDEAYTLPLLHGDGDSSPDIVDWEPMALEALADVSAGAMAGKVSAKFHNGLVEAIVAVARHSGETKVVLSGGCFQNRYLTERTIARLREEGFQPYWHQRIPPNDGGIAVGQIAALQRAGENKENEDVSGCPGKD